jgi:hypothetical protein
MKLSKGIKNFWTQISYIFLISALFISIALKLFGWEAASLITVIGAFWLLGFLHLTKSMLLQGLPDKWKARPPSLEDFPVSDLDWLQQQSAVLESLGFVRLRDYKLPEPFQSFGRSFAHPQQYCFAEVGLLPATSNKPAVAHHLTIFTLLDKSWRLSVVNRELKIEDSYLLPYRNQRNITVFDPNLSLEQVFQAHLMTRQQVITDLEITVLADVSWDAYAKFNQNLITQMKQARRRKSLLIGMIEATLYELNPKPDWFYGDYPALAAKRRMRNR